MPAINRFFVGATDNKWNNTDNWSNVSGGGGGFSVPVAGHNAYFDNNSPDCEIDAVVACELISALNTFANTISNPAGNNITAGKLTVDGGTLVGGPGTLSFGAVEIGFVGVLLVVDFSDSEVYVTSTWSDFEGGEIIMPSGLYVCQCHFYAYDPAQMDPNGGTVVMDTLLPGGADFDADCWAGNIVFWNVKKTGQFLVTMLQDATVHNMETEDLIAPGGIRWDNNFCTLTIEGDLTIGTGATLGSIGGTTICEGNASMNGGFDGHLIMANPLVTTVTLASGGTTYTTAQVNTPGTVELQDDFEFGHGGSLVVTQGILDAQTVGVSIKTARTVPGPGSNVISIGPYGTIKVDGGYETTWTLDPVASSYIFGLAGPPIPPAATGTNHREVTDGLFQMVGG